MGPVHRLGLDDHKAGLPVGPKSRQLDPENPITLPKPRAPHRALEDAELVAKSQVFGGHHCMRSENRSEEKRDNAHDAHWILSVWLL